MRLDYRAFASSGIFVVIVLLQQVSSTQSKPCMIAVCSFSSRSLECLKVLLEAGANVTARDMDKATPLHIAARLGKLQAVVSNQLNM
jgi:ankyrin repeat protein